MRQPKGRRARPPRPSPVTEAAAPQAGLAWGRPEELRANRKGELHPAQRLRIKRISIFDPWLRLAFGGFFLLFGLTQRFDSWQSWVPLAISALPLLSALNGLLAGRRLTMATVETVEGQVEEVRPSKGEAVAATLLRDGRTMLLLDDEGAGELPKPLTTYRFHAVFGVIRPPIVLAVESLE
ncbi:MAG TPA: hypothetical protein VGE07_02540 [Herpetosiphonaceae bacterium]